MRASLLLCAVATAGLIPGIAQAAETESSPWTVRLARDIKFDRPAEISYVRDDGKSSLVQLGVAVALDSTLRSLSRDGLSTEFGAVAAYGRKNSTESRYGGVHLQSRIDFGETRQSAAPTQIVFSADIGRWTSQTVSTNSATTLLHAAAVMKSADVLRIGVINAAKQHSLIHIKPRVGIFHRTGDSSVDPGVSGGTYVGVNALLRVGEYFDSQGVFNRLSVEGDAQGVRPNSSNDRRGVSLVKRYYGGIVVNLTSDPDSSLKQSLSISRVLGADPLIDEPKKAQTSVMLRVSYNL
jgi:hypothetical protein